MAFLLALDAGTTGIRAVRFDSSLRPVRTSYQELKQYFPRPGWVEHDPEEIWRRSLATLRQAAGKTRIEAIGITNQRETIVAWDPRTLRPLHRAIVWQCRRTTELCQRIKKRGWEAKVRKRTGLTLDPYFSGSKIRWLVEKVPRIARAVRGGAVRFGTVDSWILARLTRGEAFATDFTNASRTLCFDIHRKRWDADLLKLFKVRRELLPAVLPSAGHFGVASKKWLGRDIPITGIAGDQQAALYGQECWSPGTSKNTYGTGCFFLLNCGRKARQIPGLLTTLGAARNGQPIYVVEGSVFIGGAVVQWLRDSLRAIKNSGEVEAVARRVSDNGGVIFVPAFAGLGAPYWDPEARGAILGLTRGTGRDHIVRAALESIAYQCSDLLETVRRSGARVREVRVDGGAARNDFLMQFQADLFRCPVIRPANLETTVLGAAALAREGAGGLGRKPSRVSRKGKEVRFRPRMSSQEQKAHLKSWKAAVEKVRS